jgi:transcriptional regulator with XRE-family HTH domain
MSVSTIAPRVGVHIDAAKLDFELARRGITSRRLAEVSGVHPVTISRARNGGALTERNLQRITRGLLLIPLLAGVELLLPERKIAEGSAAPAISKEVSRVRGTTSASE